MSRPGPRLDPTPMDRIPSPGKPMTLVVRLSMRAIARVPPLAREAR